MIDTLSSPHKCGCLPLYSPTLRAFISFHLFCFVGLCLLCPHLICYLSLATSSPLQLFYVQFAYVHIQHWTVTESFLKRKAQAFSFPPGLLLVSWFCHIPCHLTSSDPLQTSSTYLIHLYSAHIQHPVLVCYLVGFSQVQESSVDIAILLGRSDDSFCRSSSAG